MNDTVIKGTGNSRTLKTVPNALTLYPDFSSMMRALINGTFPIDIGPLNAAGVSTRGTDLDKANLLTDALCTALGLPTTATPTQAMDKLRQLVDAAQSSASGKANIAVGSYVGNGKKGEQYPNSITFPFPPKVVFIYRDGVGMAINADSWMRSALWCYLAPTVKIDGLLCNFSVSGNVLSWYCPPSGSSAGHQLNDSNVTYHYVGIG